MTVNHLNVEIPTEDTFRSFLELAANNDLEAFEKHIDHEPSIVDQVGMWYGRQKGSSQMVLNHLTPLMVAATYGSIDVLKLIISLPDVEVNRSCGVDESTALHCAASSGSHNAVDIVKLLLASGADPNLTDANGRRPLDVIFVPPKSPGTKYSLQMLLASDNSSDGVPTPSAPEKKEYPVDPLLPDIKNSIYSTDEFRIFSFKVRPCSRAYSHDWTECPFVHPGENARRRDPRKYHYSCVPCPDFRKGACRRGDMCEYAHGVFECWLHPAQYRTRLCKDGTSCNRRVCFFAHTQDELRQLYVSTGSAVMSPRSSVDMMSLLPSSPSSPSANGISSNACWATPQNVPPALHLPGSNLQSSRLRSSLLARDIQHDHDLSLFADMLNRSVLSKTLAPSNLEDIFSAEGSSPRFPDQALAIHNQFQHQQTSVLSPIRTAFSPWNIDQSLMQAGPFGVASPGRMSPRNVDPISPMFARHVSMLSQHERFRSLSSRDLGSNAAAAVASMDETWSKWGPPNNNGPPAEWATVGGDEMGKMKRSSSFELANDGEEPDLSWVQSLVKESPQDVKEKSEPHLAGNIAFASTSSNEGADLINQIEDQSVLGAWLEQMQLDQLMAK